MLKSSMMMNLESRDIVMEDIGRQILATGKRVSPDELCRQVRKRPRRPRSWANFSLV
jgi:hypothetical protein